MRAAKQFFDQIDRTLRLRSQTDHGGQARCAPKGRRNAKSHLAQIIGLMRGPITGLKTAISISENESG